MQLNEFRYVLIFLPVVALALQALRWRGKSRHIPILLLVSSLVFYLSNGIEQTWILLLSIATNWGISRWLSREGNSSSRRTWLILGIAFNVSILLAYKIAPHFGFVRGFLQFPLGLSFFTLTQVMFLVDCYERLTRGRSLEEHATFVMFFPNITAGPILRSKLFFRELDSTARHLLVENAVGSGALLIAMGMVKKVVLGDSFARITKAAYSAPQDLSTIESWIAVFAGTLEVYFDFSGYSDIALGSAQLLGLRLAKNFDAPFRSATISEFWRRWHITLSDFITTYLYTPLLRRMGKATLAKSAVATISAMAVAGVWHGLTWNFLLFGLLHGLALAGYQYWKRLKRPLPKPFDAVLTFAFVSLVFVTVKAQNLDVVAQIWGNLFQSSFSFSLNTLTGTIPSADLRFIALPVMAGAILAFWGETSDQISNRAPAGLGRDLVTLLLLVFAYTYAGAGGTTDFRYRQF